jgi:hypothetical protein
MRFNPRKPAWVASNRFLILITSISILAGLYKLALLMIGVFPFNADEAIVGLMARHILSGKWQTFFYGQAYMGSLDATFVAAGFSLFGEDVLLIRVVQIILFIGTIISTAYLAMLIFKVQRIAVFAGMLLAIPTVNTTLYTTISLGGYGEALLIGNLVLISCLKAIRYQTWIWYAFWGFLSGLGIWAFGITLVYIIPSAIAMLLVLWKKGSNRNLWKYPLMMLVFGAFGAGPLILWGIQNGISPLYQELFGSAISGASSGNLFLSIFDHIQNLILFGPTVLFGLRPPWEVRWLALPLLPFALAFWLVVSAISIRKLRVHDEAYLGRWLLTGVILALSLGFVLTPFGADPSGRYFLPMVVPMALFGAESILSINTRFRTALLLLLGVLVFNLWGTLESANRTPPGLTTQFDSITWIDHRFDSDLIEFLTSEGEIRGYSNYWVAYPLAFQTDENILFVPKLPYHQDFRYTSRDNRYAPYDLEVDRSQRIAYITTRHPDLDQRLRDEFSDADLTWRETTIGDYQIFYDLSGIIRPSDMDLETRNVDQ